MKEKSKRKIVDKIETGLHLLAGAIGSNYSHSAVFVVPFIQKPDQVRKREIGRYRHESNLCA